LISSPVQSDWTPIGAAGMWSWGRIVFS
jgi:hypothetical protein